MKKPKQTAFEFQEVPLDEARQLVMAGHRNYSEIKAALLETLPALGPNKAFAFGLGNDHELDFGPRKSQRRKQR